MTALFKIRMGGNIRWSLPIVSGSATFQPGNVMEVEDVSAVAYAKLGAGGEAVNVGLAIDVDPRTSTTRLSGGATINRVDGNPSGDQVSLLMDEAIVEDDEVASGITFEINDKVYYDNAGHLTNVATNPKCIGRTLNKVPANTGNALLFLFSVQLDVES